MNTLISRIARPLVAGLAVLATQVSLAAGLVEGQQYTALRPAVPTNVAPGKVEVVEVFWYACGHCYLLEPKLEAWNKKGRAPYIQRCACPRSGTTC